MPQAGVQPLNVYIPAEHLPEAHLMRPKLQAQIVNICMTHGELGSMLSGTPVTQTGNWVLHVSTVLGFDFP